MCDFLRRCLRETGNPSNSGTGVCYLTRISFACEIKENRSAICIMLLQEGYRLHAEYAVIVFFVAGQTNTIP